MMKIEVIGNLGANAERKSQNGRAFVQFNVAHSEKFVVNGVSSERTTWVSCFLNGDGGSLFQYLVKGTKVYIRGNVQFRIFDSAKSHQKEVGVSLDVREIELCGGK